jgi:diaminohydroxyphosphoribosylaminopyrimidine deaminase/5-amino-6-(5-phosphoribosylamino)uracil reductase
MKSVTQHPRAQLSAFRFPLSAFSTPKSSDLYFMRLALRLARRGFGRTSPNPMVGAVLVREGAVIGQGWHHRAGQPHAEIEALRDAQQRGLSASGANGATLYVTLEPCSTHGRTPPCTSALIAAGIRRVVAAAHDPNPAHDGRGFAMLERAGIEVSAGLLAREAAELNEAFHHWIVHRTPLVAVKAGMSLDGKIATVAGESRWITGEKARALGMKLRAGADAILVGVKTILADDPSLTVRLPGFPEKRWRRIILDPRARTPLTAKVVSDPHAASTIVVVTKAAPSRRAAALGRRARVLRAPARANGIDLRWLLKKLGQEEVTSLLVEGGGETNAAFLSAGLAGRVAFFYAPLALGGRGAPKAVAGEGVAGLSRALMLRAARWRRVGEDLYLSARAPETAPARPRIKKRDVPR